MKLGTCVQSKKIAAGVVGAVLVMMSSAVMAEMQIGLAGGVGLTLGGDTVATVYYYGGSSTELNAGELAHIWGGVVFKNPDSPYSGRVSLGYFSDSASGSNGSVDFSRLPLEVLGFYNDEKNRFGGGITYHMSTEFDPSDLGGSKVTFDDAMGLVLEYGHAFGNKLWFGLRYVSIDYSAKSLVSGSIDGSHVGFYVSYEGID